MKIVDAISITVYTEYGCRGWFPLLIILTLYSYAVQRMRMVVCKARVRWRVLEQLRIDTVTLANVSSLEARQNLCHGSA